MVFPPKANCPDGEYESKAGKFEYIIDIIMQKGFASVI